MNYIHINIIVYTFSQLNQSACAESIACSQLASLFQLQTNVASYNLHTTFHYIILKPLTFIPKCHHLPLDFCCIKLGEVLISLLIVEFGMKIWCSLVCISFGLLFRIQANFLRTTKKRTCSKIRYGVESWRTKREFRYWKRTLTKQ